MLYQDTLTGMRHEVPDSQYTVGGWRRIRMRGRSQMVYDGLGNPWVGGSQEAGKKVGPLPRRCSDRTVR